MARSEFSLINDYFKQRATPRDDVVLGIGDDAAVMQPAPGEQLVVTTDTLVEGVHFPLDTPPFDIGYKLMAVNLSDLAAMGASPRWASLALTLPTVNDEWLEQFSAGLFELAERYQVQLVGGDTTRGPLTLSLTLHGVVPAGTALTRSGARVGDTIYVSGQLGDAGLALQQSLAGEAVASGLLERLQRPSPRVALGSALRGIASAVIDISDGLLADLGHILAASGVGASLQLDNLPLSAAVQQRVAGGDWSLPLAAGDDYELCFTVSPEHEADLLAACEKVGTGISRIGLIEAGEELRCLGADGELVIPHGRGYEHFSGIEVSEGKSS